MKRRKSRRTVRRYQPSTGLVVVFIFFVVLLGFGVWLFPFGKSANGDKEHTLGEDSLTSCPSTDVIMHGPRDRKEVALTFDADMTYSMDRNMHTEGTSYVDRDLIKTLVNTDTKATMFLSGLWIRDYPDETKTLAENPLFELGNHSFSHPTFSGYCYGLPQMEPLSMVDEITITQELLKSFTGIDNKYFRFPGGCVSDDALNFLRSQGIKTIHWDTVGEDGFNTSSENIISNILDHVQNGSIIVMHMNGAPNDPKTSQALPTIISALKNRGYTFVTVSELLN